MKEIEINNKIYSYPESYEELPLYKFLELTYDKICDYLFKE